MYYIIILIKDRKVIIEAKQNRNIFVLNTAIGGKIMAITEMALIVITNKS